MPNLRKAYFTGLVLLSLVQLFIASTPSHLLCLAMASLAAALTGAVLLRRETFVECPLSSLQVLMFSAVTQSVPLLATTLEWKSIAYNLELPVVTFAFIGGTQLVLLGTHAFYRRERGIQMPRKFLTSEVSQRLGLFVVPTVVQLWILGFVGLGAMVLGVAGAARDPSAAGDGGGTLLRLLDGFKPLAYAPFLVVVMPFFSSRVEFKLRSSHYVCVGLYFLVILALSLVVNSRGAFAAPLLMAAFLFALAVLLGKAKVRLNHAPFLCGAVLSCLVIAGPLSDLAAAMEIARAKRGTVSGFEVAQESLRIAFDRERLQAFRE